MSEQIDMDFEKIEAEAKLREQLNEKKTQELIEKEVEKRIAASEAKKKEEAEKLAKENELEKLKSEKLSLEEKYKAEEAVRQEEIKQLKSQMGSSKGVNRSPFDSENLPTDVNIDNLSPEQLADIEEKSKELFLESQGLTKTQWNRSLGI